MKKLSFYFSLVLILLASCQTEEIAMTSFDDVSKGLNEAIVPARQITDDVNSKEVDNILDKLCLLYTD
ncbi:MAG: hypothetical protein K2H32_02275, partial [Muribaculaceae bacterium]|nr:hypothetical protein [Muribaculaceae bacterium]